MMGWWLWLWSSHHIGWWWDMIMMGWGWLVGWNGMRLWWLECLDYLDISWLSWLSWLWLRDASYISYYPTCHDILHVAALASSGWWFQSLWKILVNWDYYSQYMGKNVPNHQPVIPLLFPILRISTASRAFDKANLGDTPDQTGPTSHAGSLLLLAASQRLVMGSLSIGWEMDGYAKKKPRYSPTWHTYQLAWYMLVWST